MIAYLGVWALTLTLSAVRQLNTVTPGLLHPRGPANPLPSSQPGDDNSGWRPLDYVIVLLLAAFVGSRVQVGTDYQLYDDLFAANQSLRMSEALAAPQEVGFTAISIWVGNLGGGFREFLFLCALLTVFPVYSLIKRHSLSPVLAIAMYVGLGYYLSSFNVVRQVMAASLLFVAGQHAIDRKWKLFAAFSAGAAVLHSSAILVILPLLLCLRLRASFLTLLFAVLVAGLSWTLLGHFPGPTQWVQEVNPRYELYLSASAAGSQVQEAGIGSYLQAAFKVLLLISVLLIAKSSRIHLNRRESTWFAFSTLGLFFFIVGLQSVVISRLELFFGMYLILLIPNVMVRAHVHAGVRMLLLAATGAYLVLFVNSYADLIPYRTSLI